MFYTFFMRCVRYIFRNVCRLLPIKSNKVVVSSYVGRGYGDNPKYIVEELLKRKYPFKIIWLVKNESEACTLPRNVESCEICSLKAIYHLATAKIWIDNCRKAFYYKRKHQKYIQTWHGFGLKKIEKDVIDKLAPSYESIAKKDSKQIDIIVSDSAFMTKIYKNSFYYDGDVVEWGAPRNDILVQNNEHLKNKVFDNYGLSNNKKIILYAPTFRADKNTDVYQLDLNRIIEAFNAKFDADFSVLVRLHPNIADKCEFIKYDEKNIINATYYPDMQELLAVADVVISDYSSLMFDFVLTKKPCFIFATDIEVYMKDRNFYFSLDSTPFPVAENNEELVNNIKSFYNDTYIQNVERFLRHYNIISDGLASKRCADWISNQLQ